MPKVVTALISRDAANRNGTLKRGGGDSSTEGRNKWQRRRLLHMLDKRRRFQLKLLRHGDAGFAFCDFRGFYSSEATSGNF